MKLTDETVKDARCPDGVKDMLFFDDVLPGFALRVTKIGPVVAAGCWLGQHLFRGKARRRGAVSAGRRLNRHPFLGHHADRQTEKSRERPASIQLKESP
jgi:hypothetical protein